MAAADRIEEGVNKHSLRGAASGGHANGDELSNPKFDPCWKKGGGAGLPWFYAHAGHSVNEPAGAMAGLTNVIGSGKGSGVIGNPLETTILLWYLIFDGTFDRFPG